MLACLSANAQLLTKKEFSQLKKKALSGDVDARCDYAYAIFSGNGCKADEQRGMEMLRELMAQYPDSGYVFYNMGWAMLTAKEADTAMAIAYFNRGADLRSTSCMNQLGRNYLWGNFSEVDYAKANDYFDRAVALESPNGNLWKGYMLLNGMGCDFSPAQALPYLEKSYRLENGLAADLLGNIYAGGIPEIGLAADLRKSAECYLNAVKWGYPGSYMGLARLYLRAGDIDQADHYFGLAAQSGEMDAYFEAEVMYYDLENWEKCRQWSERGDKAGNKDCSRVLGWLYEYGLGTKVNYKKAAEYYKKDTTDVAYSQLGDLYLEGHLGKLDKNTYQLGRDYHYQAAELGNESSIYTLGSIYLNGNDFEPADYARAAHYFRTLADLGSAQGQYIMGRMHEEGLGVEQSADKAVNYYRLATEQGHSSAACYLGDYYREGCIGGVEKNPSAAFAYYVSSANDGNPMGYYYTARSYLEGCGVEKDTAAAVHYLSQAARGEVAPAADRLAGIYRYGAIEVVPNPDSALAYYIMGMQLGNAHSCFVVGSKLLEEGSSEMAVQVLDNGAQRGSDSAMVLLSKCMLQGVGMKTPNPELAYSLVSVATTYGNSEAYYIKGLYTRMGIGCQPEEALAKSYLDTSAAMGNAAAMYQLVFAHEQGYGCDPDHEQAVSWLRKSASLDYAPAINLLITLYMNGDEVVAKDESKAFALAKYGADILGSLGSLRILAQCYQQGIGCVLSTAKAVELYTKAAEHGSVDAMVDLYELYSEDYYIDGDEDEIHIESNPELAFSWLQKAVEGGSATAQYYMGAMYEQGVAPVKADKKLAKKYYKLAADQGFGPARAALYRLK